MTKPHLRTRSKKRLKVTVPGSKSIVHFKKKTTPTPLCYLCGKPLAGLKHLGSAKARSLNRTRRRIWRPFGGQLCHNCLKNALREGAKAA